MLEKSIARRVDTVAGCDKGDHVAPIPLSVKIELTSRCNFKCAFCATSHGLRPKGDMDIRVFRRITSEMKEAGVKEIGLFYLGESMLYHQLCMACRWCSDLGFDNVFLTTNGSQGTREKFEELFEAGLTSLKFSLNYASPQQFIEIARVNVKFFDRIIANIKTARSARDSVFKKTGKWCQLSASSILYDGDQHDKMQELVSELRPYLDEVYELPLYTHGGYTEGEAALTPEQPGNQGRIGGLVPALPCWALWQGHVTWDAKLAACCFGHTDKFEMADLNKVSFQDGWNSEEFQELRKAHMAGSIKGTPCESCFKL